MPKGLALPLDVNSLGRATVVSGSEQLGKLLIIAIQPCSSDNPFQDLGLPENLIFDINSPTLHGKLNLAIQNIFASFEKEGRARLRSVNFENVSETQELKVFVEYQDLETMQEKEVALMLPRIGNVRPRVVETEG